MRILYVDLYAEKFDPVMSEEGRWHYHDISRNQSGLGGYVARLQAAGRRCYQLPR